MTRLTDVNFWDLLTNKATKAYRVIRKAQVKTGKAKFNNQTGSQTPGSGIQKQNQVQVLALKAKT